jgi:hypothetical protein
LHRLANASLSLGLVRSPPPFHLAARAVWAHKGAKTSFGHAVFLMLIDESREHIQASEADQLSGGVVRGLAWLRRLEVETPVRSHAVVVLNVSVEDPIFASGGKRPEAFTDP